MASAARTSTPMQCPARPWWTDAAVNATSSKLSAASGAAKKKVTATSSNKELKVELEKSLKNELYEDAFTKVSMSSIATTLNDDLPQALCANDLGDSRVVVLV